MDMDRSPGLGAGGVPGGGSAASSPAFPGSHLLGQASPLAVTTAAGVSPASPSKSPSCSPMYRVCGEVGHVYRVVQRGFPRPRPTAVLDRRTSSVQKPGNDNSAAFPLSARPPRLNRAGRAVFTIVARHRLKAVVAGSVVD
ncbi:Hypp4634 [Branchiostoma lanceolatum]|uniref:Hypp4634 protein n=1 Tax=Branchiostoma lanceolatum TaxID=7740 RepID=A0A8K0A990_BRALA|nr:Hypp4634 [Branchiostoma lanceolatum]